MLAAIAPLFLLAASSPEVVIETNLGTIEVRLAADKAPATVANFLRYVDAGAYAGGTFHRTVTKDNQPANNIKIEVVQAGAAQSTKSWQPVPLERTSVTGLRHRDGVISMARDTPDSATSDFFICIGDQPSLDFGGRRNPDGQGFAAFGQVVRGMDVVRRIQAAPADGQKLMPPVRILQIRRKP